MKNFLSKFLIVIVVLFSVMSVFAKQTPPSPGEKKVVPPGLPIDDNVSILLIMGLFLGMYIMYKYQFKTKASIF
ncbi:MAG TPA: hypothetical protein VIV55_03620 [Flavobacterium sp.]